MGNEVSGIVRLVPGAGPPAADAVDTVIDLLAPPPPGKAATGAASANDAGGVLQVVRTLVPPG